MKAYLAGLKRWRSIDDNPERWICTLCGGTTPGDEIMVSYGQFVDTPQPVCSKPTCGGIGPDLLPMAKAA